MNSAIRHLAVVLVSLFVLLILNLSWIQGIDANALNDHPANAGRTIQREYARERGPLVSSDGVTLAESIPTRDDLRFLRRYPLGALTGQVTGYVSVQNGSDMAERAFGDELLGSEAPVTPSSILDRLEGDLPGDTVELTVDTRVQKVAADRLDGRAGSVVALDPRTGAVLALYSNPTFDPNPLAAHDAKAAGAAFERLNEDPDKPLLPRAYREIFPPGSTFKIITTTAALTSGVATPDTTFPVEREISLPQTNLTLSNFENERCGGTLVQSFTKSCNTVFGSLALQIGPEKMAATASGDGFEQPVPFSLRAVQSNYPDVAELERNKPELAFSGIGQGNVAATPLEMCLTAAAIANGGVIMTPQVGKVVRDPKGSVISTFAPRPWLTATDPQTAAAVKAMMVSVVQQGTGRPAAIDGVQVAGKSGTAQTGRGGEPHAWFVAFAPAEAPRVAVAVLVEEGGGTGGTVAGPIAADVMEKALEVSG
ncbi:MAG: penicillin-binding protein 2 [Acidimicrobiia bacterium]|nr:penicillin-binding protein 2 [Acidimicrobiia bacterium]